MESDYFYAADDCLNSARKFANFWGAESDLKHSAKHVHQVVLCALKAHAENLGCQFPLATTDLMDMLGIVQARDAAFLSSRGIPESAIMDINGWSQLSIYDHEPAPTKEQLLGAISIGETLSIPVVDLMDPDVEPTDEQWIKLLHEMGKAVRAKKP